MVDVRFDEEKIQRVVIVYDPEMTDVAAIRAVIEKNGDRVVESAK